MLIEKLLTVITNENFFIGIVVLGVIVIISILVLIEYTEIDFSVKALDIMASILTKVWLMNSSLIFGILIFPSARLIKILLILIWFSGTWVICRYSDTTLDEEDEQEQKGQKEN